MKKNILFLLFALILTGNPILGMKRKREIGDDPNPTKRRKLSHQTSAPQTNQADQPDEPSRKRKRDDNNDTNPKPQKQRMVIERTEEPEEEIEELEDLKDALDVVPDEVITEFVCKYLTFAELHALMLSNKHLYNIVQYFFTNILRCNPQDIRDLLMTIFYQKVADVRHICIVLRPQAMLDYDQTRANINRITQFTRNWNCPFIIDCQDPHENITIGTISKWFKETPNLQQLHIDKNQNLWKRFDVNRQRQIPLSHTHLKKYSRNFNFVVSLIKLNQLHFKESPYVRERKKRIEKRKKTLTEREIEHRRRTASPQHIHTPNSAPTTGVVPAVFDYQLTLNILSHMTDQELDQAALINQELALMIQLYRARRN